MELKRFQLMFNRNLQEGRKMKYRWFSISYTVVLVVSMVVVGLRTAYSQQSSGDKNAVRQGPRLLTPGEHGIGRMVADVEFKDIRGKTHKLKGFSNHKAIVIAMTSTSCPLSKKYLPTLVELAKTYSARDVAFVLVNTVETDKAIDMQSALESLGSNAIYAADTDGKVARAVQAKSTTDVIVLDSARTVFYHGAIDDQYGFGYAIDAPKNRFLADAIDADLANESPVV